MSLERSEVRKRLPIGGGTMTCRRRSGMNLQEAAQLYDCRDEIVRRVPEWECRQTMALNIPNVTVRKHTAVS